MSLTSLTNVQDELINFGRSLVKDPTTSRFTTTSQDFVATAGQTEYTLTYYASCINSVTVASVAKSWGSEYSYTPTSKKVTLVTGATVGQTVTINYDYVGAGTTLATTNGAWGKWVYPSLNLQPIDYPRFGMAWLSKTSGASGIGLDGVSGEAFIRIWVYDLSTDTVKDKLSEFAGDFFAKNDWYFDGKATGKSIIPVNGPTEPTLDARRKGKYFGGFIDLMIPLIFESRS